MSEFGSLSGESLQEGHGELVSCLEFSLEIIIECMLRKFNRIYDADPVPHPPLQPGKLARDVDPPLEVPDLDLKVPQPTPPNQQERYSQTPVYNSLT